MLITPPLPAVSLPSINTSMRAPVCFSQWARLLSSTRIGSSRFSYSFLLSLPTGECSHILR